MSSIPRDKIVEHRDVIDDSDVNNQNLKDLNQINPLVAPLPWWYEFYKRIRLVPWWLRYNIGIAKQADLRDKIIKLSTSMELDDKIVN